MLPQELQDDIESFLCNYFEDSLQITSAESVSGGSINQTFKLSTKNGCFFLKFNEANRYPRMFESESKGLALLADTKTLRIPKVLTTGETQNYTYLLMEYIEPSSAFPDFWEYFGQQLAALHQTGNEYFGLDHDNYMGSLLQSNIAHDDWVDFFIEERLEKQVKLAKDENRINSKLIQRFDKLYVKLSTYFPPEPPSLIHGDLWSGNFMTDEKGAPVLIDPAVAFGHREADIAMSQLFGGFDADFYTAYNEVFPMEEGWQSRMDIYNLYPLMIHVNLFGEGYVGSVKSILKRFVG